MGNKLNIAGERYGKLVALLPTNEKTKNGGYKWLFRCDCGNTKIIPANSVRSGHVKSCGCLTKLHGCTNTRLFHIWVDMKQRCENPNHPQFYLWGGKGIKVCDEWHDFLVFKKWAESSGYCDNLSIDRINGERDYCPENCRWATAKQQARNTKANHRITIDGETKALCEWIELSPITSSTYHKRKKRGMSDKDALWTPSTSKNHFKKRDLIVQECKQQGIETMTPQEIAALMEVGNEK